MTLINPGAEVFVPDGTDEENAFKRITHLAVGAHQDDLELMATSAILECFQRRDKWFCGVTVTDGRGSPRNGLYRNYSDEEMSATRKVEQRKAATVGEYGVLVQLDYSSASIKESRNEGVVSDLRMILEKASPDIVLTHNLADKHDTHVAVALRVIEAIRLLPPTQRPERVLGCEVWRNLDWLLDEDKVLLDCSERENLQASLFGIFDSQISGGKRYDLATQARLRANATYLQSHDVDKSRALAFAMDLTPLATGDKVNLEDYVTRKIERFKDDVVKRIRKLAHRQPGGC